MNPSSLLEAAQDGNDSAIGELLQYYRPYLSMLARLKADRLLQSKLSDSDLVQETCLSAHRDFAQFRGVTEPELTAWLRKVMAHVAANHHRDFRRKRRDVRLERELTGQLNDSSQALDGAFVDPGPSPSQSAIRRERAVILATALEQLPPDHREVIVMRDLQGVPLTTVADRMGRNSSATQKLWARAHIQLKRLMEAEQ